MAEHHRAAQRAAQEAKRAVVIVLTCSVCRKEYETTAARAAAKVCPDVACRKAARATYAREWKDRNRERWRAARRRREWGSAVACSACGVAFFPTLKSGGIATRCEACVIELSMRRLQLAVDRWLRHRNRAAWERSGARLRARARYQSDAGYRARMLDKRRRQWEQDPEREAMKVWRWSIRKRYGAAISPTLMLLLEERRELWRDLYAD